MIPGWEHERRDRYLLQSAARLQDSFRELLREAGVRRPRPGVDADARQAVLEAYRDFREWHALAMEQPAGSLPESAAADVDRHLAAYAAARRPIVAALKAAHASTRTLRPKNIYRAPEPGESWTDRLSNFHSPAVSVSAPSLRWPRYGGSSNSRKAATMAQNDQAVKPGVTNDNVPTIPSGVRVHAVAVAPSAAIEVEELAAGVGGDGVWLAFVSDVPFLIIWGAAAVPAPLETATNAVTPDQRCIRWPADVEYTRFVDQRARFFRVARAASAVADGVVRIERTSEILGASNALA